MAKQEECSKCKRAKQGGCAGEIKCSFYGRKPQFDDSPCSNFLNVNIKCPECGQEVSPTVSVCPNCGCPMKEDVTPSKNNQSEVSSNATNSTPQTPHKSGTGKVLLFILVGIALVAGIVFFVAKSKEEAARIETEKKEALEQERIRQERYEQERIEREQREKEQREKEQREKEEREKEEKQKKESLMGYWVYNGTLNGYRITSELKFTESTMEWLINGEQAYRGRWDVSFNNNTGEWYVLYNPVSSTSWKDVFIYDPSRGIEFEEGKYYVKSDRQIGDRRSSYSSDYTFRRDQDVYEYLSSHRFQAGNLTISFGNGGTVALANGNQFTNAIVVRDFDSRRAILAYTSPISPGWHTFKIDNTAGTLTDGVGHVYYSR